MSPTFQEVALNSGFNCHVQAESDSICRVRLDWNELVLPRFAANHKAPSFSDILKECET